MFKKSVAVVALAVTIAVAAPHAQRATTARVTGPKEQFGHEIGDNYRLVNYTQYVDYLKKMDAQSERMMVVDIGKTEEGRTELTAIITSPENHRKLPLIKEANRKLALADGITDDQARQLARDGKAIVWIDGGLHATEVLGAQQLIETIYRLNTKTDPETLRILSDTVILCTLVNPDGMELVSNWYMRQADEKQRSTNGVPRLYQKYIGHDDSRDFYMMNMSESTNANKMMYREWFPVIMYNHHQTGPAGAVLFAPPFRDPFNYNFDPLIPLGIDTVGAAIHTRLAAEGKPGAVMRTGAPYSTWFNGGIRTTSYFHNQIGILTETIGNPTPVDIPFVLDMQVPRADVPNPIQPRTFYFREAVEYSVTNNYAILDIPSKRHEDFLYNMYKMAKNAIDKGNRDNWTIHPTRIAAAREAIEAAQAGASRGGESIGPRGGRGGPSVRRHRLQPRVLDGRQVRPHPRRVRRSVRENFGSGDAGRGQSRAGPEWRRLSSEPRGERLVRRGEPLAEGERRGLLDQVAVQRERQTVRRRHDVHSGEGVHTRRRSKGRGRQGSQLRCGRVETRGRFDEAQSGAHWPLGSVRRIHALRLDALGLRAVRVPVRGGVSADARRRESQRQVRRARVRRRRDSRAGPFDRLRAGRRWRRRRIPRAARVPQHPVGGPRLAGSGQRPEDRAGAEEVRRERRHRADDRIVDLARPASRPADSRRAGRDRQRRLASAPAREVLRAGIDSRSARRQHASARLRHASTRDGVLRREPRVPPAAGRGDERREADRVVRDPDAAAQRLGLGPAVPRSGGVDRRSARRPKPRCAVRQRSPVARAAARDVQAAFQRHLLRWSRIGGCSSHH